MKTEQFFSQHPVFTLEEFINFQKRAAGKNINLNSLLSLLNYHARVGNILRIRRGFYAYIPISQRGKNFQVNPYLIAGRIVKDSVLVYHTALDLQGFAYSTFNHFYFVSEQAVRPFEFQGVVYQSIKKHSDYGIVLFNREGLEIRSTSLERTLVDLLARPNYGGGWSEIWSSYELVPHLNIEQIVEYTFSLNNATTVAKIGFYLEQQREKFSVTEEQLIRLQAKKPRCKHYIERNKRTSGKFIKQWNIVVPAILINQHWEEPNEIF